MTSATPRIPARHRHPFTATARGFAAVLCVLAISSTMAVTITPSAGAAPVGEGFSVTASDLSYILKQIKIAEAHVANTTSATGPCGALVGTGPDQLASPLLAFGLRTVDGSCNNLVPGQEWNGSADQVFPRLTSPVFRSAGPVPTGFGPPASTSYGQKSGNIFDTEPRMISNLIVDQTSTNPAAVAAAGLPVRTQGNVGVVPCTKDPDPATGDGAVPADCTPSHQTLFIPNVTTDVGLSPPYNSMFTLFGQFFDHGLDQTVKGGGTVFIPLNDDDPLIPGPDHIRGNADDLPSQLRFMVMTRGKNQPGPDGVLGTADDIQDALNTDSPWVDLSQSYSSHPSHQVFLRQYRDNADGRPVATGKLLGGAPPAPAGQDPGMATWADTKAQARTLLGLELADKDVTDIPMLVTDAYGNFTPGPLRGLPQYMTATGPIEGDTKNPVPVPGNALHFQTPFLTDIAQSATPTPGGPDADHLAGKGLDTPTPAGTYDNELLDAHFIAGDGRANENIGLTAIHQVFESEHNRLVDDISATLGKAENAALRTAYESTGSGTFSYGARLFQAARFVTEMEYQHLVFEEFARKVQPAINPFEPFAFTQTDLNPAIRAEFAHAVYRFGHSMLTETISRTNESRPGADGAFGTSDDIAGTSNNISLLDGFLNPQSYTDGGSAGKLTATEAAGSIVMGMSDQVGSELDEFVTETLRNNLLGLPLDLATINLARARSEGIPPLNVLRRQLFAATNDGQLAPYKSWVDLGENLKHPESLINFVAAYGRHPTIVTNAGADGELVDNPATEADETADNGAPTLASRRDAAKRLVNPAPGDLHVPADAAAFMNSVGDWSDKGTASTTGLDDVDLWVGGLAENTSQFGGLLGSTFNYVFENQMTDLQNGDRFYYLARTPGMNLRTQLEGNSFAEMLMRNTNANTLKADAFATADCKFQLGGLAGTPAGFAASGNSVADDPNSECNETALLIRQPDGTIQYRQTNTVDPSGINGQAVYNGTDGVDRVRGGNDNDTFWAGPGNDVIEGGFGADTALGGEGDDIITDAGGDDTPKGGPGNDAINAGPGLDIVSAGDGNDFTNGGANANETFAGEGDDFLYLGQGLDTGLGDGGNDWEEGGDQPDLLIGDSSNLFFLDDSQRPGSDILIGQGGDDDYDMEGGNDIGVAGQGIEKVAGASGYDFEIGQGDQAQDSDLNLPIAPLDILQVGVRDRFNEVEALSGWNLNDTLRGDDVVPVQVGGGGFIGCDALDQAGVDMIAGLDPLLPPLNTSTDSVVATSASKSCPILAGPNVWGSGNILLGGGGSDLIEGRGADDIIDGDRYLGVRLSIRDPKNPAVEIGSADVDTTGQSAMTSRYLRDAKGVLIPGSPTLQEAVFAGTVNPGNIVAIREILTGSGGTDTAVFSGPRADYDITPVTESEADLAAVSVAHTRGAPTDGTDLVRNVEILKFADDSVTVAAPGAPTIGTATATNTSATVNFSPPADQGLIGFIVEAMPVSGGPTLHSTLTDPTAGTATVNGLTNGTAYTLRVAATNPFGTGSFSAASNVVTPVAPPTPAPVVALSPAAGLTFADTPVGSRSAATGRHASQHRRCTADHVHPHHPGRQCGRLRAGRRHLRNDSGPGGDLHHRHHFRTHRGRHSHRHSRDLRQRRREPAFRRAERHGTGRRHGGATGATHRDHRLRR